MINYNRLNQNPQNAAFVNDIDGCTMQHPFHDWLRCFLDDRGQPFACIELTDGFRDGEMTLGFIQTLEKGRGHGSDALQLFLKIAKRHDMIIHLTADRVGTGGLTQAQLKSWYKRHGFTFPKNGRDGYIELISDEWKKETQQIAGIKIVSIGGVTC